MIAAATIRLPFLLFFGAVLFSAGVYGVLARRNAVLVLISRAHLVDFEALTELVLEGRFKAAIDVFPAEPLPPDHPRHDASIAPACVIRRVTSMPRTAVSMAFFLVNAVPPAGFEPATHGLGNRCSIP